MYEKMSKQTNSTQVLTYFQLNMCMQAVCDLLLLLADLQTTQYNQGATGLHVASFLASRFRATSGQQGYTSRLIQ